MTGNQSPANRYQEIAVKTANPMQLVVMLYDAAISSIQEARRQLEKRNIADRSRAVNHCIAVISELQSCLDKQAGGEIAHSLDRLYDYMKRCLFKANVDQSIQPLTEAEALLENLRSAWSELLTRTTRENAEPPAPHRTDPGPVEFVSPPVSTQVRSLSISV